MREKQSVHSEALLDRQMQVALRACPDLPTLPAIAVEIIGLAQNPDADVAHLEHLLGQDPALASRILKAANSSLIPRPRGCESLRQAIIVIGLNATFFLALSFSLVPVFRGSGEAGTGLNRFWQRVLTANVVARVLGEVAGRRDKESLALGALLQDVGVLALRALYKDRYEALLQAARSHDELLVLEREGLGVDHGVVGSWLLEHWHFPAHLACIPSAVHADDPIDGRGEDSAEFVRLVRLAGRIADVVLQQADPFELGSVLQDEQIADQLLAEVLDEFVDGLAARLQETERLFEVEILSPEALAGLLDQSREARALREHLVDRRLAERNPVQATPRLANRTRLDEVLSRKFRAATESGVPLSLAFVRICDPELWTAAAERAALQSFMNRMVRSLVEQASAQVLIFSLAPTEFAVLLPGMGRDEGLELLGAVVDRARLESADHPEFQPMVERLVLGLDSHMDGEQLYARPIDLIAGVDQNMAPVRD